MKIIRSLSEMRQTSKEIHKQSKSLGCVLTMGYLHEGHLSLVRGSRQKTDVTVATIFVNPTQFGPNEDFECYPRNEAGDLNLLESEGTDIVYIPEMKEIYPVGYSTYVEPPLAASLWCGKSRPVHFKGVCTVVTILLNIIQPTHAFFGQKDAQQCAVIHSIVRDLRIPVEIIVLPTIREADGLAMSSRNAYLSPQERKDALVLSKTLSQGKLRFDKGETNASLIVDEGMKQIQCNPNIKLDYLAVVDETTFQPVDKMQEGNIFIGAIYAGSTRLIDNIRFEPLG